MHTTAPTAVRQMRGEAAAEHYFTAMAPPGSPAEQARALYGSLATLLAAENASLFSERLFATAEAFDELLSIRQATLGALADAVDPVCLVVPATHRGAVSGLQAHAIVADQRPQPLTCWDGDAAPSGRMFAQGDKQWLFITGRCAPDAATPGEQADHTFRCARCLLEQHGATMDSVARTWLWLDDVLDWYGDLNTTRNQFFREQGLIDPKRGRVRLPASTGIGIGSVEGRPLTLDLIAMPGQEHKIRTVEAGGDQDSAYKYGSAFSRACVAPMPAGDAYFVSGTASIDPAGHTEFIGDIDKQITATVAHVRALLKQVGCNDSHVLTALHYCKTPAVLEAYERLYPQDPWPLVTMISDVCRDDLLFEIELTAAMP
jgi:enamine deaminase RidA (YjgF/YER057c/UK114 family)